MKSGKPRWGRVGRHARGALRLAMAGALAATGCARRPDTLHRPGPASPVVRGADNGLEVWWWVVSDSRVIAAAPVASLEPEPVVGPEAPPRDAAPAQPSRLEIVDLKADLGEIFSTYEAAPAPTDAVARERLHAAGLRLVAVPIEDLAAIESRLRLVGAVQRQWLGEPSQWTDVARGPNFRAPRTVTDGRGVIDLDPGALRLMLRAWVVPEWAASPDGPRAAMRVELVPEHVPERQRLADPGRASGKPERDEALESLRWTMVLRPGEACILVPESPDARWDRPSPDPGVPTRESGVGPEAPAAPSLGEAMLTVDREAGGAGPRRRVRAIIVLIPRLPDRFHLSAAGEP